MKPVLRPMKPVLRGVLASMFWILLPSFLNGVDALITLRLWSMGLEEMNPAMKYLINVSPDFFFAVKVLGGYVIGLFCDKYPTLRYFLLITLATCLWNLYILVRILYF